MTSQQAEEMIDHLKGIKWLLSFMCGALIVIAVTV